MMKLVVLSCLLATAAAGGVLAPLAYTAPFAYTAPLAYTAPWLTPSNYRGPLSLAPGQPANILGSDGRPLDTLDVNLDRSAHFTAKAIEGSGLHLLKKRSAPLIAPVAFKSIAVAPTRFIANAAFPYSAPLLSTHIPARYAYANGPFLQW